MQSVDEEVQKALPYSSSSMYAHACTCVCVRVRACACVCVKQVSWTLVNNQTCFKTQHALHASVEVTRYQA